MRVRVRFCLPHAGWGGLQVWVLKNLGDPPRLASPRKKKKKKEKEKEKEKEKKSLKNPNNPSATPSSFHFFLDSSYQP
jgi:hypothetical protein